MKFNSLIKGLLAGAAVVAYTFAIYSFKKETLFTGTFYFSSLLIYAIFMYWAAVQTAKASFAQPILAVNAEQNATQNEGDFRGTLRSAFGVFLIANACYYLFDYWLFNHFDPMMNQIQAEAAIEMFRNSTPSEEMQKLSENIRSANIHNVKSLLFQFGKGAIGGFGLSIVLTFLALRK